jgi:NitT/TauT family transport system permease protein
MNAVPRIALIPIIVVIFGATFQAAVVIAVLTVYFVAFFSAYQGGRNIAPELLQNSYLLGATRWQIMTTIRFQYCLAWTLHALPLAVTFGLISVVTGEIMTGYAGLGRLIEVAAISAQSSLTFAVVVVLSVLGLLTVGLAEIIKRRMLHWWEQG